MLLVGYHDLVVAEETALPPPDAPQLLVSPLALAVPGVTDLVGSNWRFLTRVIAPADLPPGWEGNPDPWQAAADLDATGDNLYLRVRKAGDRFCPLGLAGRQTKLGEFFINEKVDRALRTRWPLVVGPRGIVWVPGLRLDERVRVHAGTQRILWLECRRGDIASSP